MFGGLNPLVGLGLLVLGAVIGYFVRRTLALSQLSSLERKTREELESAESKAKETVLTAKSEAATIIEEAQKEERERKQELRVLHERLLNKEDSLDKEKIELE